jgi:hypothetical protein
MPIVVVVERRGGPLGDRLTVTGQSGATITDLRCGLPRRITIARLAANLGSQRLRVGLLHGHGESLHRLLRRKRVLLVMLRVAAALRGDQE